jgi:endonuclease/exonuclease/phosphatase family metal-dependent hydrolase
VGQVEHFAKQINIIKNAIVEDPTRRVIVVGDFNLDDAKKILCRLYKSESL